MIFKNRDLGYALINSNKVGINFLSKMTMIIQVMYIYSIKVQISVRLITKRNIPVPLLQRQLLSQLLAVSYGYFHISKQNAYVAIF